MLLYVHIPFCTQKCYYCSFFSSDFDYRLVADYFRALKEQFRFEIERFGVTKKSIETIFIGGGTPSLIDIVHYEGLISFLEPYLSDDLEFTCEANPESLGMKWIEEFLSLGLNRLSIGVQSFDDKKLKFLGRIHDSNSALEAVNCAHKAGVKNISIDMMYESALDDRDSLLSELELSASLPISHISAYALTIEKGSLFEALPQSKKDDENQCYFVKEFLESKNFSQYEVSNFGRACKHNLGYWEHRPYIGLGASAVGFLKNMRFSFEKNTDSYIKNPINCKIETLTHNNLFEEKLFLGLRSCVGVELNRLSENQKKKIQILENENMIFLENDKFFSKNYFLADEIALFLLR